MKKTCIVSTIFTCSVIFLSFTQHMQSNSNGSLTAYMGAPKATTGYESTCLSCHGGTPNMGPHTASIAISVNLCGFTSRKAPWMNEPDSVARYFSGLESIGATVQLNDTNFIF